MSDTKMTANSFIFYYIRTNDGTFVRLTKSSTETLQNKNKT